MIPRCRTDKFSRSFLPAALRLWNLLPSGVFSSGTLISSKTSKSVKRGDLVSSNLSSFFERGPHSGVFFGQPPVLRRRERKVRWLYGFFF